MKTIERSLDEVKIGDEVTVWGISSRGYRDWGQGGKIVGKSTASITLQTPVSLREFVLDGSDFPHGYAIDVEVPHEASECLDFGDTGAECKGAVDLYDNGGTRAFPRCRHHQELRWERRENSMERYADSSVAPSWFDPTYAGESWDED